MDEYNENNLNQAQQPTQEAQPVQQAAPVQQAQPVQQETTEWQDVPVYRTTTEKKEKTSHKGMIIMGIVLAAFIIYSGIQTVYIFRLNSGLEGISSYLTQQSKSDAISSSDDNTDLSSDTSETAEPWFSLADAAAVYTEGKETLTTTQIADKVSPSTVSVYIYGQVSGVTTAISSGTGFIITADGYIVTNAHVVEDADDNSSYTVKVKVPDIDEELTAEIVGMDEQTDIAVLKVSYSEDLPCVTLGDSDELQAGELVVAIGNALGTYEGTVTVGVVSALDREINEDGYTIPVIQTDTAINEGNSGGPLINSYGEVIGITNAKIVTTTSEGLGFAIPINSVKTVIESLINYGKVINRPYLGISVSQVSEGAYYGVEAGVYVAAIVEGGPGDQAGFELGDRIISVDGVEITESGDIIDIRDEHAVGDQLKVVVDRDGQEITLTLTVGDSGDFEDATYKEEEDTQTTQDSQSGNSQQGGSSSGGWESFEDFFNEFAGGNSQDNGNSNSESEETREDRDVFGGTN